MTINRRFKYWLAVGLLVSAYQPVIAGEQVDYFDDQVVDLFELKDGSFVASGSKPSQELMTQCLAAGAQKIDVVSRKKNYAELKCNGANVWVRRMSFTPVVTVEASCPEVLESKSTGRIVVVIAGVRGAGAEKNACK